MKVIATLLSRYRSVYYFIILLLSISCSVHAPRSLVLSVPTVDSPPQKMYYETQDYRVDISPLGNEHKTLAFQVNVWNKNLDSMIIDPHDWSMQFARNANYQSHKQMESLHPIEPHEMAAMYDSLAVRAETNKQTGRAIGTFLAIVLVVGVIVLIFKEGENDDEEEKQRKADNAAFVADVGISVTGDIATSGYRDYDDPQIRHFLNRSNVISGQDINKFVLKQGESKSFVLYFKRKNSMKYLKLIGPSYNDAGTLMEWWFAHRLAPESNR